MKQDQERLLEEAANIVREQAAHMKRAIEVESLRDTLKHASNLICELRTSQLSPKNYYALYVQVFQELQQLAAFLADKRRHNRKLSDLYESVQHAGNIVPRLYLLVTVGSCYIKSKEAPHAVKAILSDMAELCKGVQHPMRGLFLRYYLSQMCKDYLPSNDAPGENETVNTTSDVFEFLFDNFTESARLWVRLQHQGATKEQQRREKERHDLRVLVGANLVRMAQLDGMTPEFYAKEASPRIIKRIISFKDPLAQQYLLDCVIQVFSDDCHLKTLSFLLDSFLNNQCKVDLKPILSNLMIRLEDFAKSNPEAFPDDVDVFGLFHNHILQVLQRAIDEGRSDTTSDNSSVTTKKAKDDKDVKLSGAVPGKSPPSDISDNPSAFKRPSTSISSLLDITVDFLHFTLALYTDNTNYVERILCATSTLLASFNAKVASDSGSNSGKNLEPKLELSDEALISLTELLAAPLRVSSLAILMMEQYPYLMMYLTPAVKREVASAMVAAVLESGKPLEDSAAVAQLFSYVSPLVCESLNAADLDENDSKKLLQGQQQVCRLIQLIHHRDTDVEYSMLCAAHAAVVADGSILSYHLANSLIFCALRLVPRIVEREIRVSKLSPFDETIGRADSVGTSDNNVENLSGIESLSMDLATLPNVPSQKVLQFIHKACRDVATQKAECALQSFLHAAIVANDADLARPGAFEPICYEFLSQALVCFEEEITESKSQSHGILMFVGVLGSYITCLEADNYDNLAAKVAQHGVRLLRKSDSCRAVYVCSNLFWNNPARRNETRVLECLQKCLRIADIALSSSSSHIVLFVDILEKYIYYYEQNHTGIVQQTIVDLVALCAEHLSFCDMSSNDSLFDCRTHFSNVVRYIWRKSVQTKDIKYQGIHLEDVEGVKCFLTGVEEAQALKQAD